MIKGGGFHAIGRRKSAVARVFLRSGKGTITVNGRPAGWTRFKVSFDGPSGPSVRADILDVQDVAGGTVITVISNTYAGGTPLTIAVSWVDGAGTTSPIAYFTCSGGIPMGGSC